MLYCPDVSLRERERDKKKDIITNSVYLSGIMFQFESIEK